MSNDIAFGAIRIQQTANGYQNFNNIYNDDSLVLDPVVLARGFFDISAVGCHMVVSAAVSIVSLPIRAVVVGVSSYQNGDGIVKAIAITGIYTMLSLFSGLDGIVRGAGCLIIGLVVGTGLELLDRCVRWKNTEFLGERIERVNVKYLINRSEEILRRARAYS